MKKQDLYELADDLVDSNTDPDWEVNLNDLFASVFEDVTEDGKCLVVYQDNTTGEIENVEMFDNTEETEAHLNALQDKAYEEEDIDV